jgi:hypothetical protein
VVGCKGGLHPDATFSAQAELFAGVKTLQQYADQMKSLLISLPDGAYEVKSSAVDDERKNVCDLRCVHGEHTGQSDPCAPTSKRLKGYDDVYVMDFDGDEFRYMMEIWRQAGLSRNWVGANCGRPGVITPSLPRIAGLRTFPLLQRLAKPVRPFLGFTHRTYLSP